MTLGKSGQHGREIAALAILVLDEAGVKGAGQFTHRGVGIGRFGGIAGSFVVAELARRHVPLPQVFVVVGIPGLIAAAALFIKDRFGPPQKAVPVQFAGAH